MCVQRRLVCSAGVKPAGARVRRPVAWMAGWRETKTLKHIDKVSLGEITSHRAVMKVNAKVASKAGEPDGRARIQKAKAAWGAEIGARLHHQPRQLIDGECQHAKVYCPLMFGVLALAVDQLT